MSLQISKIKYAGESKIIKKLCEKVNAIIDASGSGSGGSEVTVNPILTEGINIADITIDGDVYSIFAPEGGGGGEECLVHDVRVDGVSVVQDKIAYINLANIQNQIDDILLLLNAGYWQDENDEYITDELGNRILFN